MKTVALDFDAVIHKYSNGWQNGEIYDPPVEGALQAIKTLLELDYSVFIFSTREPKTIVIWLSQFAELRNIGIKEIPFWQKYWNTRNKIGVTKIKLPAHIYVDDRGITFTGNWSETLEQIKTFSSYLDKDKT